MNDHQTRAAALGRYTPLRAYYDAGTEARAWEHLLAFFDEHMPA